jgi:hypothetical protein
VTGTHERHDSHSSKRAAIRSRASFLSSSSATLLSSARTLEPVDDTSAVSSVPTEASSAVPPGWVGWLWQSSRRANLRKAYSGRSSSGSTASAGMKVLPVPSLSS